MHMDKVQNCRSEKTEKLEFQKVLKKSWILPSKDLQLLPPP